MIYKYAKFNMSIKSITYKAEISAPISALDKEYLDKGVCMVYRRVNLISYFKKFRNHDSHTHFIVKGEVISPDATEIPTIAFLSPSLTS